MLPEPSTWLEDDPLKCIKIDIFLGIFLLVMQIAMMMIFSCIKPHSDKRIRKFRKMELMS